MRTTLTKYGKTVEIRKHNWLLGVHSSWKMSSSLKSDYFHWLKTQTKSCKDKNVGPVLAKEAKLTGGRIRKIRMAKPFSQPCQEDQIHRQLRQVRHFCRLDGAHWSQAFRPPA
jgi:hypothetical protein